MWSGNKGSGGKKLNKGIFYRKEIHLLSYTVL